MPLILLVSVATLGAPTQDSGEFTCDCAVLTVAPAVSRATEPSANVTANFLSVIAGLSLKRRNQCRNKCCCPDGVEWIGHDASAIAAKGLLSDRSYAGVFAVQRHSRAAEHDWIPAVSESICCDVAVAPGHAGANIVKRLLSDVDLLEARQSYVLRIEVVVRFQESAVKSRSLCAGGKRRS